MKIPKMQHQASFFDAEEINTSNTINTIETLSILDAASIFSVSQATIRNWIKAGHIIQAAHGGIDVQSIDDFKNLQISKQNGKQNGKQKLTARANKTLKDSHDHAATAVWLNELLHAENFDTHKIANQYENSLSESFRNQEGIFYTPPKIIENLFQKPRLDFSEATFCDPCCGAGNFLVRALELGFKPENIFGYDTDANAVAIAERRIFDATGKNLNNIKKCDFLKESLGPKRPHFDFIFTNPPWGKKILREEKENFSQALGAGRSLDTSALFFFACVASLNDGGQLGLLLPDSFFNIASFEDARSQVLKLNISRLIDYGKPFKGLLTKAVGIVAEKVKLQPLEAKMIACEVNEKIHFCPATSFDKNPRKIFNFQCSPESVKVINHLYSLPHTTLEGKAQWGLGIVTGDNEKYCQSSPRNGFIPVFRGADLKKIGPCEPSLYIPSDLSLYQQVAPKIIYEAKEKLIYKFISSELCFFYDSEQNYALNSANMLVPSNALNMSAKQLCAMLNSDLLSWLFKSIFMTHKILRGDLEKMPIFPEFFQKHTKFNEEKFLEFLSIQKVNHRIYRVLNKSTI